MTALDIRQRLEYATGLHQQQRYGEAVDIYLDVLSIDPANLDAQTFLASAYRSQGRSDEAIALYAKVAESDPVRADFWFNMANALSDAGQHARALESYGKSIALEPRNPSVLANLAIALAKLNRTDEAVEAYREALAIDPQHRIAAHNLGNILADRGQSHEAIALLRQTVRNWPDLAEGHYNLSLVLLRLGDFANGFAEYEWRWQTTGFFTRPGYRNVPVWAGEPLAGKRIIVHSEQGLGDTIQFSKVLGLLASLGGDVVFHVPEKLEQLLKTLPFPISVTAAHGASDADFQIPLMSLPHRLKMTLGSVPSQRSYLSARPDRIEHWSKRVALDGAGPAIGVVWQGNPNSPAERGRSLPRRELLAPLAALERVRLIALQKLGEADLERTDGPTGWRVAGTTFLIEHPGPDMDEGPGAFIDTAAIMAGLDLVVSVCTAPLHLAGALGRPSVALLRTVPDWRWMEGRTDTPWYPSMGLVRQGRGESYGPAIERAAELAGALLRSRTT